MSCFFNGSTEVIDSSYQYKYNFDNGHFIDINCYDEINNIDTWLFQTENSIRKIIYNFSFFSEIYLTYMKYDNLNYKDDCSIIKNERCSYCNLPEINKKLTDNFIKAKDLAAIIFYFLIYDNKKEITVYFTVDFINPKRKRLLIKFKDLDFYKSKKQSLLECVLESGFFDDLSFQKIYNDINSHMDNLYKKVEINE